MSDGANTTVITLICERAVDLDQHTGAQGELKDVPGVRVIKFPCSGMIQPLMIEAAVKAGASGVIVCGCQIGDCYYREGNRMIRERLLGDRPPGLKKTVDRRRVIALWLSKPQASRFISEAKEFVATLKTLATETPAAKPEPPKPAPAAKPAESKAEPKLEPKAESKPESKAEPKAEAKPEAKAEEKAEAKPEAKAEEKAEAKPEAKAEEKAEAKPESKAEEKKEPKAENEAAKKAPAPEAAEASEGAPTESGEKSGE